MTRERDSFKPQVFGSMEERDRWQRETYGTVRNAFREPEDVPDERPLVNRREFWASESERLTYEHAAETNPKRPDEGPGTYIARLAAIATGRYTQAAKPMPRKERRQTDAEWNERNNELLRQLEEVKS